MSNGFFINVAAVRPALVAGQDNIVDVLIRVQAPDSPKEGLPERPRLNLAIVIDRSGSMSGQPLHEAKRCAAFMIDSLKATDRASVIAYDDSEQVCAENQAVTRKEHFKRAIAHIEDRGSTNLHGGWLKGAEETAKHLEAGSISRVLLLSDGNANSGLIGVDEIASQCAQLAGAGVTTSTYGLGHSFNEELMMAMARSGRANGYYSETAESLLERFHEEFSLLASVCARDVRLRLSPLPGVQCEMLNLYSATNDGAWCLPDLAYDGEAWAAVRLHVNAGVLPRIGETLATLQASVIYRDLHGTECQIPESWLSLPIVTAEEFRNVAEDQDVISRVKEAEAARLQESARRAAKRGDWNQVDGLLAQARSLAAHSPWLREIVVNLERLAAKRDDVLFSKEAGYAAMSLGSKLRSKMEFAADFDDSSVASHLQRKVRQGAGGHYGQRVSSTYQLDIFDNHPVALIEGKRVVLDTGSPFSIGDGRQFEIAGRAFSFHGQMGVTTAKLSQWMNTQIDALLGTDVLSEFVVTLDWWGGTVAFSHRGTSAPLGVELPAELFMGTPVLQFSASNRVAKGIFDTGAKLCYMPRSEAKNLVAVNHAQDFHVIAGAYETDVYEVPVEIAGHRFVANCGVLPDALASMLGGLTGIDWIIGTDLLRQGVIGFDLSRGCITAVWKAQTL